jgi:transcriptional regulator with XRE-family HTH domain
MAEIEEQCATRLRELRKRRDLTLRECEERSAGRFKAVVMGSYERGTRAISLERLQELADFYEVPIQYFLGGESLRQENQLKRFTFDLRKLRSTHYSDESITKFSKLLLYFVEKRSDWNGEVLSIRGADGELLPTITDDPEILEKLDFHGLVFKPKN